MTETLTHPGYPDDIPKPTPEEPRCFVCGKRPADLEEYIDAAAEETEEGDEITPLQYMREDEGTFNAATGGFACTDCYIDIGMPSLKAPDKWTAP